MQPNVVDSAKSVIKQADILDSSKKDAPVSPGKGQGKAADSGNRSAPTQEELDKQCEIAREK